MHDSQRITKRLGGWVWIRKSESSTTLQVCQANSTEHHMIKWSTRDKNGNSPKELTTRIQDSLSLISKLNAQEIRQCIATETSKLFFEIDRKLKTETSTSPGKSKNTSKSGFPFFVNPKWENWHWDDWSYVVYRKIPPTPQQEYTTEQSPW